MTAISDFCTVVRGWLNFEDYSDALVTSWVRMALEDISTDLRCKHMIQIDTGTIEQNRVLLPSDWLDLDYVVVGGKTKRFRTRDEWYNNVEDDDYYNSEHYTITGNYLIVSGASDDTPLETEISYYQTIPMLGTETNWVHDFYYRLLLSSTLAVATSYGIEDERGALWQSASQALIDKINTEHQLSKTSGSLLVKKRRHGFG